MTVSEVTTMEGARRPRKRVPRGLMAFLEDVPKEPCRRFRTDEECRYCLRVNTSIARVCKKWELLAQKGLIPDTDGTMEEMVDLPEGMDAILMEEDLPEVVPVTKRKGSSDGEVEQTLTYLDDIESLKEEYERLNEDVDFLEETQDRLESDIEKISKRKSEIHEEYDIFIEEVRARMDDLIAALERRKADIISGREGFDEDEQGDTDVEVATETPEPEPEAEKGRKGHRKRGDRKKFRRRGE